MANEYDVKMRMDSRSTSMATQAVQMVHEMHNAGHNFERIKHKVNSGMGFDLGDYPKKKDAAIISIASGASLDLHIEKLKKWTGDIICSTSQATTLIYHGIEPTYILALDPFCNWKELEGIDWRLTKTKLITQPCVWPDIIEKWPNEQLYFFLDIGAYDKIYSHLKNMYTVREVKENIRDKTMMRFIIPTSIIQFACSPPTQLLASATLGYNRIFLLGHDFGYFDKKARFTKWFKDNQDRWIKEECLLPEDVANYYCEKKKKWNFPEDYQGEFSVSDDNTWISERAHLYYKKNFLSGWRLGKIQCWQMDNTSLKNIVPYVNIEHVIRKKGKVKNYDVNLIIENSERYLAKVGCFIIDSEKGSAFVESKDPVNDLVKYIKNLNRQYICKTCQLKLTANDDLDHSTDQCPQCGNADLTKYSYTSLEDNINKIVRYLNIK